MLRRLPFSNVFSRSVVVAVVLSVAGPADSAAGKSQADQRWLETADRLLAIAEGRGIRIGVFAPINLPGTNYGPGCVQGLTDALNDLQPDVIRSDAKIEISGNYTLAKTRKSPELAGVLKITVRMFDLEYSEELDSGVIRMEVDSTQEIAAAVQATVNLKQDGSKAERNRQLIVAARKPSVSIAGPASSEVAVSPTSPYRVEVWVRDREDGPARPSKIESRGGQAFVDIRRGQSYELKITNRDRREIAVRTLIDGIDMFQFSRDRDRDGKPRFTHMIVPAGQTQAIAGWHHSVRGRQNFRSFLVTTYGQGAHSQSGLPAEGNLGVIHLQFAYTSEVPAGGRAAERLETGLGNFREIATRPVSRQIDVPHACLSIRYLRDNG